MTQAERTSAPTTPYREHALLTADVLRIGSGSDRRSQVDDWLASNQTPVDSYVPVVDDIRAAGAVGVTTLSVALRVARELTPGRTLP